VRRLPIRVRLTAWYTTILVVVLAVLGAYQVQRLRADLTRDLDRSLELRSAQIAAAYRADPVTAEFTELSNSVLSGLPTDSGAQLLAADGTVIDTSEDAVAIVPMLSHDQVSDVLARLGPDPLRADADPSWAWTRISKSRRPIGALLMDQTG